MTHQQFRESLRHWFGSSLLTPSYFAGYISSTQKPNASHPFGSSLGRCPRPRSTAPTLDLERYTPNSLHILRSKWAHQDSCPGEATDNHCRVVRDRLPALRAPKDRGKASKDGQPGAHPPQRQRLCRTTTTTATRTKAFLERSGVTLMAHPPHSPDLAPCDCFVPEGQRTDPGGGVFEP